MNNQFANFLSFIPFFYFFIINILWFLNKIKIIKFNISGIYIVGLFFTTITAQIFKSFPYPDFLQKYSVRPKGAKGCDYLSMKGNVEGVPALPSGHMATTGYFVFFNILIISKYFKKYYYLFVVPNIILLVLMGWARYIKKCHNLLQIFSGSIYGMFLGKIFFNLIYK